MVKSSSSTLDFILFLVLILKSLIPYSEGDERVQFVTDAFVDANYNYTPHAFSNTLLSYFLFPSPPCPTRLLAYGKFHHLYWQTMVSDPLWAFPLFRA